jgi:hypothetical protein
LPRRRRVPVRDDRSGSARNPGPPSTGATAAPTAVVLLESDITSHGLAVGAAWPPLVRSSDAGDGHRAVARDRWRDKLSHEPTAARLPQTEPADMPRPLGRRPSRSRLAGAAATDAIVQAVSELSGAAHTKRRRSGGPVRGHQDRESDRPGAACGRCRIAPQAVMSAWRLLASTSGTALDGAHRIAIVVEH